jgi:hypothetical protein
MKSTSASALAARAIVWTRAPRGGESHRTMSSPIPPDADAQTDDSTDGQETMQWRASGWTARIIKSEDGDGWAVEMTADGESEPALVGPWTMGRDKKNPKPLDKVGFATLLKGANEVRARHAQQLHAQLHKSIEARAPDGARMTVRLDIATGEDDPHATLTVEDKAGTVVSRTRVAPNFKLTSESARQWLMSGDRES